MGTDEEESKMPRKGRKGRINIHMKEKLKGEFRCWRRTDEELKVAGSNSTESILPFDPSHFCGVFASRSGIMDYVPDVGHLFDSLKNLFR